MPYPESRSISETLREPGDHPIDVPITCVITRFGLRSSRFLLPTFLDYRRVLREAWRSETPGLLRAGLLVENATTLFSVSLWSEPAAVSRFGTNVPLHVDAARAVFDRLATDSNGVPELWSTKWHLASVSNNLSWRGFDLRGVVRDAMTGEASGSI